MAMEENRQHHPAYDPEQKPPGAVHPDSSPAGENPAQAPGDAQPPEAGFAPGAQPQYYPTYNPQPNYYYVPQDANTPDPEGTKAARTALILGIIAFVVPCIGPILGIVAIVKALAARRLGCFTGEAIGGLVLGILSLSSVLLWAIYGLVIGGMSVTGVFF